jgi:hypothetical protein
MRKIIESERIAYIERKWNASIPQLFRMWHWKKNLKHSEIGEKIDIPRSTITRWFKQFNIPTQSCTRFTNLNLLNIGPRKTPPAKPKIRKSFLWKWDTKFFETWSPEMAYVLGFLVADGYVFTNPRGSQYVCFVSADKEIIEEIRKALKSNHKIGIKKQPKHANYKNAHVLQIGNKEAVTKLKSFGIIQNKSLVIKYPKGIPEEFLGHFVRGYFDGDGCVYLREHFVKGRKKKKWIFQTRFTSGSRSFLVGLHKALKPYVNGGAILDRQGGHELIFSHKDGLALYNLMYNNTQSRLFLERKYKIFQKAIETLHLGV